MTTPTACNVESPSLPVPQSETRSSMSAHDHEMAACPAINTHVYGLAECSLGSVPHRTHRLLCEATGEVLGEWTEDDPEFRDPCRRPRPHATRAGHAA